MFKQLFLTEVDVNKKFLIASLIINALFFFPFGPGSDMDMGEFVTVTLVSYWILLIASVVVSGDEKRTRQLTQLPVTPTQIFLAGWLLVLLWLSAQVCVWLTYGWFFDSEFSSNLAADAISTGLGASIFIVIVSIILDLGAFRPSYVRWLFVGALFAAFTVIINLDLMHTFDNDIPGFVVFPVGLFFDGAMEVFASFALLLGLLVSDYFVYRFSDSYLG